MVKCRKHYREVLYIGKHVWKHHRKTKTHPGLPAYCISGLTLEFFDSQVHNFYCHSSCFLSVLKDQKASLHFVSLAHRSATIWGHVVFATQETSPYDIAVVSLEEDLGGVPTPVPAEHFHEGKGQRAFWSGQTPGRKSNVGYSNPVDEGASPLSQLPSPSLLK